jgi:hypothetical protein
MEPCTALAMRECLSGGLVARCEERRIAVDEVSPRICSCEGSASLVSPASAMSVISPVEAPDSTLSFTEGRRTLNQSAFYHVND